jgi:hypothetical protein
MSALPPSWITFPTVLLGLGWFVVLLGCRTNAPIHVWRPPNVAVERHARIAIAPVAGSMQIAGALESALLSQRPAVRSDVAVITSHQLLEASPIRLASTDALSNDLVALQAAKSAGADFVLCGQIIDQKLDVSQDEPEASPATETNMNQVFFQRLGQIGKQKDPGYHLVMTWNVLSTHTGQSIATQQFKIQSSDISKRYPDLQAMASQPNQQLITACARETWKSLAPFVEKDQVRLATPWFQPGMWRVQRGVRAAKKGQWQIAEQYWQSAADGWLPSPAAHHNLAVAKAARENFSAAKRELQQATGPLSRRLPPETLVWLDYHHKLFNQAHQLPPPAEGWAFQPPESYDPSAASMPTVDESLLPW